MIGSTSSNSGKKSANAKVNAMFSSSTASAASNLTTSNSGSNWTTYISPGGTIGIGNSSSGYLYSDLYNTSSLEDLNLKALIACLPENKIEEIMDIAKENAPENDIFKNIIRTVVSYRHFSEDFLLKYVDYLDKNTLLIQHKENIYSREYHSLALLLEEQENN